jgi:hypothetical protein
MNALAWTHYVTLPLSFVLQLATAVFILRRRQVQTFPVFLAYTVFHLLQGILSFIAYRISYTAYFYEWWVGELLDVFFAFAVIQEIFVTTFKPYEALRRWGTRLYMGVVVLLSTISVFMGIQYPHGYSPRVSALFTLDRSANFVEIGLLFFLFLFCRLFGMTWRHYVFGIAAGFVLTASTMAGGEAIRSHFGRLGNSVDAWVGMTDAVGFMLAVAVWAYYFASSKSRVPLDKVPGTEKLVAWNRALSGIER